MNHQVETGNWKLETVANQLLDYCQKNDFAGYDPYDALNSEFFRRLPFLDSRLPRLVATQALKRIPFNLRPLLMVPSTQNPKAIALFLMAFLKLSKLGLLAHKGLITLMVQKLIDLRSPDVFIGSPNSMNSTDSNSSTNSSNSSNPYWNWGYSFPWQTRTILVPKGAPNLVCTVFVANALLDLYEHKKSLPVSSFQLSARVDLNNDHLSSINCEPVSDNNADLLSMATSAAEYILNELYWKDDNGNAGFSYPLPSFQTRVHNANFLGAALFCRILKHTDEKKYLEPALKAARYSARMQNPDGSWDYGEHDKQQWIDNFHTGYNLGALRTICNYLNTDEFEPHIRRGFKFYREHFFREDSAPKYFHNETYPIDIHSVAQSIITLIEFRDLDSTNVDFAQRVFNWATTNMWGEEGYFYYQITPWYKDRIPYMRWSEAWMLLALATMLEVDNG
jgi:hypothetical protein